MQGVTKSERNREDYKKTGFKETENDDWYCMKMFEDCSRLESRKPEVQEKKQKNYHIAYGYN